MKNYVIIFFNYDDEVERTYETHGHLIVVRRIVKKVCKKAEYKGALILEQKGNVENLVEEYLR